MCIVYEPCLLGTGIHLLPLPTNLYGFSNCQRPSQCTGTYGVWETTTGKLKL